jgi:hypothetical protein
MSLPKSLQDREYDKFEDKGDGLVRVRTSVEGTIQTSGLTIGGRVSTVSINDTTWTALPAVALANRNAVAIQNYSGQTVKLNYNNTVSGFDGVILQDSNERYYDISDTILLYAKCSSGTVSIVVEEIA